MKEYHKIQTVFYRDMEHESKRLKLGVWSKPEFEYLQHNTWYCEEKIDGTNIRVMWDGTSISINGKTDNANLNGSLVKNIQSLFSSPTLFNDIFPSTPDKPIQVCLYGEGFGPGIQKAGSLYTKNGIIADKSFILFDVKVGELWLERQDVIDIAQRLHCLYTQEVFRGTLLECIDFAKKGYTSKFGDFIAEGIIARPLVEMKNRRGERIITKLKYEDFRHDLYQDPVLGQLPPQE